MSVISGDFEQSKRNDVTSHFNMLLDNWDSRVFLELTHSVFLLLSSSPLQQNLVSAEFMNSVFAIKDQPRHIKPYIDTDDFEDILGTWSICYRDFLDKSDEKDKRETASKTVKTATGFLDSFLDSFFNEKSAQDSIITEELKSLLFHFDAALTIASRIKSPNLNRIEAIESFDPHVYLNLIYVGVASLYIHGHIKSGADDNDTKSLKETKQTIAKLHSEIINRPDDTPKSDLYSDLFKCMRGLAILFRSNKALHGIGWIDNIDHDANSVHASLVAVLDIVNGPLKSGPFYPHQDPNKIIPLRASDHRP
jgi:hypothetical protein